MPKLAYPGGEGRSNSPNLDGEGGQKGGVTSWLSKRGGEVSPPRTPNMWRTMGKKHPVLLKEGRWQVQPAYQRGWSKSHPQPIRGRGGGVAATNCRPIKALEQHPRPWGTWRQGRRRWGHPALANARFQAPRYNNSQLQAASYQVGSETVLRIFKRRVHAFFSAHDPQTTPPKLLLVSLLVIRFFGGMLFASRVLHWYGGRILTLEFQSN